MEVYFSGTIERIIFENPSNFYRILLLEIDDTDAEDFDDFEIIVTGTMADVIEGEDYTFGDKLSSTPSTGNNCKSADMNVQNQLARDWLSTFQVAISRGLVSRQLRKSSTPMATIPLTKFCNTQKS